MQTCKTGEHGASLAESGVGGSKLCPLGRVVDVLQGICEHPNLWAELCVYMCTFSSISKES